MAVLFAETVAPDQSYHDGGSCRNRWQILRSNMHERTRCGPRRDSACSANCTESAAEGKQTSSGTSSAAASRFRREPWRFFASGSTDSAAAQAVAGDPAQFDKCQTSVSPGAPSPSSDQSSSEQLSAGCHGEQAVAADVTSARARDELNGLSNQFEAKSLQRPLPSTFLGRPAFGSEERLGFTSIVSTVGSWVAAAFEDYGDGGEDEEEGETCAGATSPESPPDAQLDEGQVSDSATEAETAEVSADTLLAESGSLPLAVECSSEEERPAPPPEDLEPQPRVFLHLCGQPEPILWTASDSVPLREEVFVEPEDPDGCAQQIDPRLLHVPLPDLVAETEASLEPPVSRSFGQIAKDIEMWLFDLEIRRLGADSGAEGSVCSSDSSDEGTGERFLDFARVSAYLVGRRQAEAARRDSDDGLGGLHGALTLLQPLKLSSASPTECSPTSSIAPSIHEDDVLAADEGARHAELLPCVTEEAADLVDATTPGVVVAPARDRVASHRLAIEYGRGGDSVEPPGREPPHVDKAKREASSEGVDEVYNAALAFSESDEMRGAADCANTAVEGTTEETPGGLACCGDDADANGDIPMQGNGSSSELTSEEAAAKEAATRSLGNRIWAFFGGGTGAEGTGVGGEEPTSGDAVEETIPFEDPAVVQRDDHRAFPNETLLLLESIKQQALLQVLSPQQQKYVASLMHREVVGPAASVAAEGAEPALMWCSSGEFEVTQGGFFGVSVLRTLTPGEFFGLEELVAGEKLTCSLISRQSASECVLWILDRELFLDSIKDMLAKREAFVPVAQAFLHMVPLVRDLPEEQIAAVAKACKVERFAEGQTVFKMGFHGDMVCFIYRGEAITQKPQDDGSLLELARQGRGEYFGEMALIRNARRTASVVAGTELLLLCLDKDSFEALLAPLKEKMAAKAASSYKRQDDAPPTESESKPADASSAAPVVPGSLEACVKKRTRKSSLALLNYSKIRDQEKQAEEGQGDVAEDKSTARWRLAEEPKAIHEPPPLSATGGRSCLKGDSRQSRGRTRKSPVRFDEGSLLPSEYSSDEG